MTAVMGMGFKLYRDVPCLSGQGRTSLHVTLSVFYLADLNPLSVQTSPARVELSERAVLLVLAERWVQAVLSAPAGRRARVELLVRAAPAAAVGIGSSTSARLPADELRYP
jgi:hypothetical protein